MIAPARVAAFHILMAVSAGRRDLPAAIADARDTLADPRDRALAAEIATGVQRWRAALDHLIVHFAKRPLARLDPEIIEVLRLSSYQLLHLTRVPASAVVDDAVKLAGRAGKRSAAGLVNAVLRALSRSRRSLPVPPRPDPADRSAALEYLTVTLSHPRWLMERWLDRFGFDTAETWALFNNQPAPLTLRVNPIRTNRADLVLRLKAREIAVQPGRFAPDALLLDSGSPLRAADLAEGSFVIQDEASQLVSLLAGPDPGPKVLDTCAAPGGKATAIAAAMGPHGLLVACDVRRRRTALLSSTIAASGATNVRVVRADLGVALPFAAPFTCVFVDVPCSGLGTLRRDPDIKWRRQEADLASLAVAEVRMLQHAAESVAPGGRLVYATCSSEPEENEAVVSAFLQSTSVFEPIDLRLDPGALPPGVIDDRGHLRTTPHHHGLEAFFGAVLKRRKM